MRYVMHRNGKCEADLWCLYLREQDDLHKAPIRLEKISG